MVQPRVSKPRGLVIEIQKPRFGNVYSVGDTQVLRAQGEGEQFRWQVTDFFGRELARGDGAASGIKSRSMLSQPGWYDFRCDLLADGRIVYSTVQLAV